MASTILSDNGVSSGSAGIKTTADSTGALALQTTTAGGAATTALTIDTSQNVGIGTTSPSYRVDIQGTTATQRISSTTGTNAAYQLFSNTGQNFYVGLDNSAGNQLLSAAYGATLLGSGAYPMVFGTNNTERMRIDSSGNFLVNTTSAAGSASTFKSTVSAGQQAVSFWNNATAGTRYFVTFGTEASYTERGFITWNGTTTALSNASDFRLKENIVNAPSALQKISDIQIRSFDFKEDGRHVEYGVIAQELIGVIPAAVFEGSDNADGSINKAWSVGLEPIIPVLVKAIQEQQDLITDLTARITALEAK